MNSGLDGRLGAEEHGSGDKPKRQDPRISLTSTLTLPVFPNSSNPLGVAIIQKAKRFRQFR